MPTRGDDATVRVRLRSLAGELRRFGYRPPTPEVFVPTPSAWPAALTRPAPAAKLPVEQRPTLH
ncbi:hypothetical protein [Methylorubrum thiocyanatum]|uniref:hypothetical protein n=1 Tax=Methylorubrum thiocyanatum TaxID=47958 RepID=UPI003F7E154E